MPDYVDRPGSRVLLVDPQDHLLLFRGPLDDGRVLWFPPGGGLEAGESFEDAARRELWEECGLEVAPTLCVWHRLHEADDGGAMFGNRPMRFIERYYFHRVPEQFEPKPQFIDEWEDYMRGEDWHRWLSLEEIEALGPDAVRVPRDLASLLRPLLSGQLPATPLEIGI